MQFLVVGACFYVKICSSLDVVTVNQSGVSSKKSTCFP